MFLSVGMVGAKKNRLEKKKCSFFVCLGWGLDDASGCVAKERSPMRDASTQQAQKDMLHGSRTHGRR
jgi:hypothetical protein